MSERKTIIRTVGLKKHYTVGGNTVRALDGVYAGDELFTEYSVMNPMMGVYYQITKGWAIARTEWWNMLQRVMDTDGSVEAILAEMTVAQDAANAAAAG